MKIISLALLICGHLLEIYAIGSDLEGFLTLSVWCFTVSFLLAIFSADFGIIMAFSAGSLIAELIMIRDMIFAYTYDGEILSFIRSLFGRGN